MSLLPLVVTDQYGSVRTADGSPKGNLPAGRFRLIGREAALDEVAGQLEQHRLVTLIGAGGVGKTRLAVEAAARVAGRFADGVWLVELAPLSDPDAIPDVVAAVLGVTPQPGETMTASIVQALSRRHPLLVIDNCEHLVEAAASLVDPSGAGRYPSRGVGRHRIAVPALVHGNRRGRPRCANRS